MQGDQTGSFGVQGWSLECKNERITKGKKILKEKIIKMNLLFNNLGAKTSNGRFPYP